jgi:hypothetical protein
MKTLTSSILAITLTLSLAQAQGYIDLADFGSGSFTVDPDSSTGSYSQGALGLTYSPSVALGDTLVGTYNSGPLDWSSYADLANTIYLKVVFTGANPSSPMVLDIYNTGGAASLQYQGTSIPIGVVVGANYLPFALNSGYTPLQIAGVLSDVVASQITWGGSGSAGVRVEGVATVPEPSTYALLGLAGLALAGYAVRRRRA